MNKSAEGWGLGAPWDHIHYIDDKRLNWRPTIIVFIVIIKILAALMKTTAQEDVAEVKEKVPAMLKVKKQSGSSKYSQVPQSYLYQYSHLCRNPLRPRLISLILKAVTINSKRKYILVAGS